MRSLYYRLGDQIRIVVLTSLKSLQLPRRDSDLIGDFLNNLTAPHLEEFSLPIYYILLTEIVASFLKRSACSLRSFSLNFNFTPFHFEGFMNILQSSPSLNTLSIRTIERRPSRNILQLVGKVLSSQSTSCQQGFLLNLKILEYYEYTDGNQVLGPGLGDLNYDDLYSLLPADNGVHGPLHLLKFNLQPSPRNSHTIRKHDLLPLELGEARHHSECVVWFERDFSVFYYRCRKDSLCWDWTVTDFYNLDLSFFLDFYWGISNIEK
jgi:hypothetical protein